MDNNTGHNTESEILIAGLITILLTAVIFSAFVGSIILIAYVI